ncbi:hypothetical protein ABIF69_001391 [Bradyrhizobium japonicum]
MSAIPISIRSATSARGRRGDHLVHPDAPQFGVTVESGLEQPFLVAEAGVKARRIDAHGLGELSDGGALIAMAPKHFHRLVQRRFGVEFAGASHAHVPVSSEFRFCLKLNAESYLFVLALFSLPSSNSCGMPLQFS